MNNIKEKNTGIEMLRILSMFMVVILHILNFGIHYTEITSFTIKWYISWFLEGICYCAVNIYAMISGYVMFNSRCKIRRLIELWLEVLLYSMISVLLLNNFFPELVSRKDIIKACFPIMSQRYWYFTAYFAIYWFIPFFNWVVQELDFERMRKLLYRLLLVFGIIPWISEPWGSWAFGLTGGYTALWLAIMYLVGAGIRKYGFSIISFRRHEHSKAYFLGMAVLSGCSVFFTKLMITIFSKQILGQELYTDRFYSYLSPLVIAEAIFLICLFSKIKIKQNSIWIKTSKLTFGIYLIHLSPLFGQYIWKLFSLLVQRNSIEFLVGLLVGTLAIYVGCSVIEYLRLKVFQFFRISDLLEYICVKIKRRE